MLAARDAMAAEERTVTPVLPSFASAFEGHIQWGSHIEEILMPHLHPGRFVAAPSIVTSMGAAMKVNYTAKMATRLYRHFNERKDGVPVPPTHTYVGASKVLYMHEDVARIFALWLENQGSKRQRQSKKRAASAITAAPTTTGPAAAAAVAISSSSSYASSPDSTTSPSLPLQEIDTNIIIVPPAAAAATQSKPAKCPRMEKEEERTLALGELKFRIAELRENAKFLLHFTKTEFLPTDETAAEINDLLLCYETVVVSRALKDVDEYLTQYCPSAVSKIDWKRLSYRKPAAPSIPDVEQIFSMQPIPCPVPLLSK